MKTGPHLVPFVVEGCVVLRERLVPVRLHAYLKLESPHPNNVSVTLNEVIAIGMVTNEDAVAASLYRVILFIWMVTRFHTAIWVT